MTTIRKNIIACFRSIFGLKRTILFCFSAEKIVRITTLFVGSSDCERNLRNRVISRIIVRSGNSPHWNIGTFHPDQLEGLNQSMTIFGNIVLRFRKRLRDGVAGRLVSMRFTYSFWRRCCRVAPNYGFYKKHVINYSTDDTFPTHIVKWLKYAIISKMYHNTALGSKTLFVLWAVLRFRIKNGKR